MNEIRDDFIEPPETVPRAVLVILAVGLVLYAAAAAYDLADGHHLRGIAEAALAMGSAAGLAWLTPRLRQRPPGRKL